MDFLVATPRLTAYPELSSVRLLDEIRAARNIRAFPLCGLVPLMHATADAASRARGGRQVRVRVLVLVALLLIGAAPRQQADPVTLSGQGTITQIFCVDCLQRQLGLTAAPGPVTFSITFSFNRLPMRSRTTRRTVPIS